VNSLKNMVKNEDEVIVIASIYVNIIDNILNFPHPNNLQKSFMYLHRVEEALSALDSKHRELIENDFIDRSHPEWWRNTYSCKSYLNLRYKAVGSFLVHFYGN